MIRSYSLSYFELRFILGKDQYFFYFSSVDSNVSYDIQNLIILTGLGLTLAIPIGPVNMEMIKQGLLKKNGYILGLITGIGAMSADFSIAMTVLFLGSRFLTDLLGNDLIKISLFMINSLILYYIGASSIRLKFEYFENNLGASIEDQSTNKINFVSASKSQYLKGMFLVLTNPFTYLWWMSFAPIILEMDIPLSSTSDRLIVTLMFLSGIFLWVIFISMLTKISASFASPKMQYNITRISAFIILVFATTVLMEAICVVFDIGYCSLSQSIKLVGGFFITLLSFLFIQLGINYTTQPN